jgi:hypothetical protein
MSERSFATLREVLTEEHFGYVQTDNGQELKKQPGLLKQLREAIHGGMEGTGGTAAFGSKPPFDAGAADLYDEIDRQAAEALASVDPRPTPFGTAEAYINLWFAATTEDKLTVVGVADTIPEDVDLGDRDTPHKKPRVYMRQVEDSAYGTLRRWVERIEGFFTPPKTREIQAPCPACGVEFLNSRKDGQDITVRSFNFYADRETNATLEAKCSACGQAWSPADFAFLAVAIGAVKDGETYDEVVARHAVS